MPSSLLDDIAVRPASAALVLLMTGVWAYLWNYRADVASFALSSGEPAIVVATFDGVEFDKLLPQHSRLLSRTCKPHVRTNTLRHSD
jgi:hypothetical protein